MVIFLLGIEILLLQYEIGKEKDLMFNKGIELEKEIVLEFNEGNLIKEV